MERTYVDPSGALVCVTAFGPKRTSRVFMARVVTVSIMRRERSSASGKTLQQRSGLPQFTKTLMEFADALVHVLEANGVRVPHGPAAIGGEAVAGHVNHVNVGGALGVTFFQNARAFVDQSVDAALHDLLSGDGSPRNPSLNRGFFDQGVNFRVGDGFAVAAVAVPTGSGLLAPAMH